MSAEEKVSEFAAHEVRIFSLLRDAGFAPNVIFDIGAANGTWSALVSQIFPDATFHLFEPLAAIREDYRKSLQFQMQWHPKFFLHEVALGAREEKIEMCLHEDGYGSTVLNMGGHPDYQTRLKVDQFTLDGYVSNTGIRLPNIIKIDTQGAERLIFSRALSCLRHADVVFAETWLTRAYGPDTPLLTELIDLLGANDLVLAEIGHRFYDKRHALYSCDAFFLKKDFLESTASRLPPGIW